MQYNASPVSTLFVKLYANKRPFSKEVLNYSLIASDVQVFKANKALYTMVLTDDVANEPELVQAKCAELAQRYNYANFVLVSEK